MWLTLSIGKDEASFLSGLKDQLHTDPCSQSARTPYPRDNMVNGSGFVSNVICLLGLQG